MYMNMEFLNQNLQELPLNWNLKLINQLDSISHFLKILSHQLIIDSILLFDML